MRYVLEFDDVVTSAVADSFKTVAAIIASNTAGHRARIRKLDLGPADDSPQAAIGAVRIRRCTDQTANGGTAGSSVSAANMQRPDPNQRDGVITGGTNYSAEPTYTGDAIWLIGYHGHGGVMKEWPDDDSAPAMDQNHLLGIEVAPRAASQLRVSGTIEFEEY